VKRITVFAAIGAVALVFASSAFANALTCAHGSTTCQGKLGSGRGGGSNSGGSVSGGTLPFTGFDLAGVAIVGAILLGSGVVLRRMGRKEHPVES
jgi:hypothetical protein